MAPRVAETEQLLKLDLILIEPMCGEGKIQQGIDQRSNSLRSSFKIIISPHLVAVIFPDTFFMELSATDGPLSIRHLENLRKTRHGEICI